jgi:uncharacterized protein YndB with AHSA1/START domain
MKGDETMDGRLEEVAGRWQLTFTRRLSHPREKVWRAITEPDHLEAWFPTTIEGERATSAKLRFAFREGEGPTQEGEMLAYDPPSVLEFRWGDEETLRFELRPDGEGTALTFVNRFDQLGKAARDAAGWHVCLDNLARRLAGEEPDTSSEAWQGVHAGYVESFGPDASMIGPPEGHPAA